MNIDEISLNVAREIADIDPSGLKGGHVQALAKSQCLIRDAINRYALPLEQEIQEQRKAILAARRLAGVV